MFEIKDMQDYYEKTKQQPFEHNMDIVEFTKRLGYNPTKTQIELLRTIKEAQENDKTIYFKSNKDEKEMIDDIAQRYYGTRANLVVIDEILTE